MDLENRNEADDDVKMAWKNFCDATGYEKKKCLENFLDFILKFTPYDVSILSKLNFCKHQVISGYIGSHFLLELQDLCAEPHLKKEEKLIDGAEPSLKKEEKLIDGSEPSLKKEKKLIIHKENLQAPTSPITSVGSNNESLHIFNESQYCHLPKEYPEEQKNSELNDSFKFEQNDNFDEKEILENYDQISSIDLMENIVDFLTNGRGAKILMVLDQIGAVGTVVGIELVNLLTIIFEHLLNEFYWKDEIYYDRKSFTNTFNENTTYESVIIGIELKDIFRSIKNHVNSQFSFPISTNILTNSPQKTSTSDIYKRKKTRLKSTSSWQQNDSSDICDIGEDEVKSRLSLDINGESYDRFYLLSLINERNISSENRSRSLTLSKNELMDTILSVIIQFSLYDPYIKSDENCDRNLTLVLEFSFKMLDRIINSLSADEMPYYSVHINSCLVLVRCIHSLFKIVFSVCFQFASCPGLINDLIALRVHDQLFRFSKLLCNLEEIIFKNGKVSGTSFHDAIKEILSDIFVGTLYVINCIICFGREEYFSNNQLLVMRRFLSTRAINILKDILSIVLRDHRNCTGKRVIYAVSETVVYMKMWKETYVHSTQCDKLNHKACVIDITSSHHCSYYGDPISLIDDNECILSKVVELLLAVIGYVQDEVLREYSIQVCHQCGICCCMTLDTILSHLIQNLDECSESSRKALLLLSSKIILKELEGEWGTMGDTYCALCHKNNYNEKIVQDLDCDNIFSNEGLIETRWNGFSLFYKYIYSTTGPDVTEQITFLMKSCKTKISEEIYHNLLKIVYEELTKQSYIIDLCNSESSAFILGNLIKCLIVCFTNKEIKPDESMIRNAYQIINNPEINQLVKKDVYDLLCCVIGWKQNFISLNISSDEFPTGDFDIKFTNILFKEICSLRKFWENFFDIQNENLLKGSCDKADTLYATKTEQNTRKSSLKSFSENKLDLDANMLDDSVTPEIFNSLELFGSISQMICESQSFRMCLVNSSLHSFSFSLLNNIIEDLCKVCNGEEASLLQDFPNETLLLCQHLFNIVILTLETEGSEILNNSFDEIHSHLLKIRTLKCDKIKSLTTLLVQCSIGFERSAQISNKDERDKRYIPETFEVSNSSRDNCSIHCSEGYIADSEYSKPKLYNEKSRSIVNHIEVLLCPKLIIYTLDLLINHHNNFRQIMDEYDVDANESTMKSNGSSPKFEKEEKIKSNDQMNEWKDTSKICERLEEAGAGIAEGNYDNKRKERTISEMENMKNYMDDFESDILFQIRNLFVENIKETSEIISEQEKRSKEQLLHTEDNAFHIKNTNNEERSKINDENESCIYVCQPRFHTDKDEEILMSHPTPTPTGPAIGAVATSSTEGPRGPPVSNESSLHMTFTNKLSCSESNSFLSQSPTSSNTIPKNAKHGCSEGIEEKAHVACLLKTLESIYTLCRGSLCVCSQLYRVGILNKLLTGFENIILKNKDTYKDLIVMLLNIWAEVAMCHLTSSELSYFFNLFKVDTAPIDSLLRILNRLLERDGGQPHYYLNFPCPPSLHQHLDAKNSLSQSSQSLLSYVDVKAPVHPSVETINSLRNAHLRLGLWSCISVGAIVCPILKQLDWSLYKNGVSIAMWLQFEHWKRKWSTTERNKLGFMKMSVFSIGTQQLMFSFYLKQPDKFYVAASSESQFETYIYDEALIPDIELCSGGWHHLSVVIPKVNIGKGGKIQINFIIDGIKMSSVSLKLPLFSAFQKYLPYYLILGQVNVEEITENKSGIETDQLNHSLKSSDKYGFKMGSVFLFRGTELNEQRSCGLVALGKNTVSLMVTGMDPEKILFPPLISKKFLSSGIDLSILYEDIRTLLKPLRESILLLYSPKYESEFACYEKVISNIPDITNIMYPHGRKTLQAISFGALKSIEKDSFDLALLKLGGASQLTYLVARVAESGRSAIDVSVCLSLMFKTLRSEPILVSQFYAFSGAHLLCRLLKSPSVSSNILLLKTLLDCCLNTTAMKFYVKSNIFTMAYQKSVLLVDRALFENLMINWRCFSEKKNLYDKFSCELSSGLQLSPIGILLAVIDILLQETNLYKNFNRIQLHDIKALQRVIEMYEELKAEGAPVEEICPNNLSATVIGKLFNGKIPSNLEVNLNVKKINRNCLKKKEFLLNGIQTPSMKSEDMVLVFRFLFFLHPSELTYASTEQSHAFYLAQVPHIANTRYRDDAINLTPLSDGRKELDSKFSKYTLQTESTSVLSHTYQDTSNVEEGEDVLTGATLSGRKIIGPNLRSERRNRYSSENLSFSPNRSLIGNVFGSELMKSKKFQINLPESIEDSCISKSSTVPLSSVDYRSSLPLSSVDYRSSLPLSSVDNRSPLFYSRDENSEKRFSSDEGCSLVSRCDKAKVYKKRSAKKNVYSAEARNSSDSDSVSGFYINEDPQISMHKCEEFTQNNDYLFTLSGFIVNLLDIIRESIKELTASQFAHIVNDLFITDLIVILANNPETTVRSSTIRLLHTILLKILQVDTNFEKSKTILHLVSHQLHKHLCISEELIAETLSLALKLDVNGLKVTADVLSFDTDHQMILFVPFFAILPFSTSDVFFCHDTMTVLLNVLKSNEQLLLRIFYHAHIIDSLLLTLRNCGHNLSKGEENERQIIIDDVTEIMSYIINVLIAFPSHLADSTTHEILAIMNLFILNEMNKCGESSYCTAILLQNEAAILEMSLLRLITVSMRCKTRDYTKTRVEIVHSEEEGRDNVYSPPPFTFALSSLVSLFNIKDTPALNLPYLVDENSNTFAYSHINKYDNIPLLRITDEELKITDGELKITDEELKITDEELKITDGELKITDGELKITDEECSILSHKHLELLSMGEIKDFDKEESKNDSLDFVDKENKFISDGNEVIILKDILKNNGKSKCDNAICISTNDRVKNIRSNSSINMNNKPVFKSNCRKMIPSAVLRDIGKSLVFRRSDKLTKSKVSLSKTFLPPMSECSVHICKRRFVNRKGFVANKSFRRNFTASNTLSNMRASFLKNETYVNRKSGICPKEMISVDVEDLSNKESLKNNNNDVFASVNSPLKPVEIKELKTDNNVEECVPDGDIIIIENKLCESYLEISSSDTNFFGFDDQISNCEYQLKDVMIQKRPTRSLTALQNVLQLLGNSDDAVKDNLSADESSTASLSLTKSLDGISRGKTSCSSTVSEFFTRNYDRSISIVEVANRFRTFLQKTMDFILTSTYGQYERNSLLQNLVISILEFLIRSFITIIKINLDRNEDNIHGCEYLIYMSQDSLPKHFIHLFIYTIAPSNPYMMRVCAIGQLAAHTKWLSYIFKECYAKYRNLMYRMGIFLHEFLYQHNTHTEAAENNCNKLLAILEQIGVTILPPPESKISKWSVIHDERTAWNEEMTQISNNVKEKNLSQSFRLREKTKLLFDNVCVEANSVTARAIQLQDSSRKKALKRIKNGECRKVKYTRAWFNLADTLTHERAIWNIPESYLRNWELDATEGPARIRKRMSRCRLDIPNKFFTTQHRNDAAGKLHSPLQELLFDKEIESALAQIIESISVDEKLLYTCHASFIAPTADQMGEFLISLRRLYFIGEEFTAQIGSSVSNVISKCWPVETIVEIHIRRFRLKDCAIEIFTTNGQSVFLSFINEDKRNEVMEELRKLHFPNLKMKTTFHDFMLLWRDGTLTNYEYLTQLNKLAGRSFNDLMQYPVFPFILQDYSGAELDVQNATIYRNLQKPVPIQNKEREKHFRRHYENSSFLCEDGPYNYSSHYSNSGIVLYYMIRVPPFTQLFLAFQDGSFDVPDRSFHTLGTTWKLASTDSTTAIRELIPEFFYLPEMFLNTQGLFLGVRQNSEVVDNVILPKWCYSDPRRFVLVHRALLESNHVTKNLKHWIDLVFGFKQIGKAAVEAINVFHPATYFGYDVDRGGDEIMIEARKTMIKTYGQTPRRLLNTRHPAPYSGVVNPNVSKTDEGHKITRVLKEVKGLHWGVYALSPEDPNSMVTKVINLFDKYVSLEPIRDNEMFILQKNTIVYIHKHINEAPVAYILTWGHNDGVIRSRRFAHNFYYPLIYHPSYNEVTCCAINSNYLWVGTRCGQLMVYVLGAAKGKLELAANPLNHPLLAHSDSISCLTVSREFKVGFSGGADGMVVLWDTNRLSYIRSVVIPDCRIDQLAVSETLGDWVSVTHSDHSTSLLRYYTINAQFIDLRSTDSLIQSITFSNAPEGRNVNVIAACLSDCTIRLYSTWDLSEVRIIDTNKYAKGPGICLSYTANNNSLCMITQNHLLLVWNTSLKKCKDPKFTHNIENLRY